MSKSAQSLAWEEVVSEGLELREQKDTSQWALGELAEKVRTSFGSESLKSFATSISIAHNTLREYRRVYVKIPAAHRIPHLSYRHHQLAANTENPKEWLERASDNSWSSEMLGVEIKKASGKEVKIYPKIIECDDCGKLRITNVEEQNLCTCFVYKYKIQVAPKTNIVKKVNKYSSIKEIEADDIEEIAKQYKVSHGYVVLQFEKLKNYCESKGKVYKNYKAALRNFVVGDMQRTIERGGGNNAKRGVDAREV